MKSGWRVYAPLGAIVLLMVAMLTLDLIIGEYVARRTNALVDDAMRSIDLVHDLRHGAARLAEKDLTAEQLKTLTERLTADTEEYDPLARYGGERQEWGHFRDILVRLRHQIAANERADVDALVADIGESARSLLAINRSTASRLVAEIRMSQQHGVFTDLAIGLVTIAIILGISIARQRALARERRLQGENLALVQQNLALVEKRNRELDAFAGRTAHDLRAPLNPIRGYADLIALGSDPPEETRRMAGKIRVAVDRMARVVDEMLELARSGRPAPGRAFVAQVCAEVLDELAPELHQVQCSTTMKTSEAAAIAPGALGQILRNVITNAIKYRSPSRPLAIAIRAEVADGQIVISVEDNGIGMDPDSARHAFEDFYRARPEVSGHGLGLAIVERIARSVGGSCELSSETDHGTRVTVRLARAQSLV